MTIPDLATALQQVLRQVRARPALTVEHLEKLLSECPALMHQRVVTNVVWDHKKMIEAATWLLPRLAGPAQEGPRE